MTETEQEPSVTFKPGMHEWHTAECNLEFRFESGGIRGYWCPTHGQWAYEFAEIKYEFLTER